MKLLIEVQSKDFSSYLLWVIFGSVVLFLICFGRSMLRPSKKEESTT